jgi:hypothetical protein
MRDGASHGHYVVPRDIDQKSKDKRNVARRAPPRAGQTATRKAHGKPMRKPRRARTHEARLPSLLHY